MWDGVFTSCLINIFGVLVFLRSGWIVAQAGILNAVFIVLSTGNLHINGFSVLTTHNENKYINTSKVIKKIIKYIIEFEFYF